MKTFFFIFILASICVAQEPVTMTQVKDSVKPKYPAEATAFKCDLVADDKESQKVVQAIAILKADKQIVGKNPREVFAIEVETVVDDGKRLVTKIVLCSGSFAVKEDALSWFAKLQDAAKTTPDIIPKDAKFYLHTCRHSPDSPNLPCSREELKP
jgi:hypothetical protein